MKKIAMTMTALAGLALAGCGQTEQGDFIRDAISTRGAQAMDEGLVNAEWFLCRAVSIGAVRRRYGKDTARAEAYRVLCSEDLQIGIIENGG